MSWPRRIVNAWAAAWVDGEGSVSLLRRNDGTGRSYRLVVCITQVNPTPLHILKDTFGGALVSRLPAAPRQRCYQWRLANEQARGFLESIAPYITIKQRQIRHALTALDILKHRAHRWRPRSPSALGKLESLRRLLTTRPPGVRRTIAARVARTRQLNRRTTWGPHGLRACAGCRTVQRPHCAHGYCRRCYAAVYMNAWRARHPAYFQLKRRNVT